MEHLFRFRNAGIYTRGVPNNSPEMRAKLAALNPPATALTDSEFLPVSDAAGASAERVLTDQGYFVSSPADGWVLHGPFA